jgi:hypothetical protein
MAVVSSCNKLVRTRSRSPNSKYGGVPRNGPLVLIQGLVRSKPCAALMEPGAEARGAALEGLKVDGCFAQSVDIGIDLSAGYGMFDRVGACADLVDRIPDGTREF